MDTSNDNIRKLFDMLDNPAAYSEQEISDIIDGDEETQETYRLMVEAKRSSRWKQPGQPCDVDAAWRRFEKRAYRDKDVLLTFRKIAAIFLAAAFLGGLAWAISGPLRTSPEGEKAQSLEVTSNPLPQRETSSPVLFADVRLDSMLIAVAQHYDKAVSFGNDELKGLRIYTRWNPEDSLSGFIENLNELDGLLLTERRDTIFVQKGDGR